MNWLERAFASHQRCKEITRLGHHSAVSRAWAGLWAASTGWRLALRYRFSRPRLPEPLPEEGDVVISLTSFPPRMGNLWMVIDMLMRQRHRPAQIYLSLFEKEFPGRILPASLQPYLSRGLKVLWYPVNLKPHLKYRPVFEHERASQSRLIVTVDDDIFYSPDLLERLLALHAQYPDAVCANLTKLVEGPSYAGWSLVKTPSGPSSKLLALGFGGVLYPPSVYKRECFYDTEHFLRDALGADDLWLYWCERKEGIGVATGDYFAMPPSVPSSQRISLSSENVARGRNDRIWAALNRKL